MVAEYWVEQILYGCPDDWHPRGDCNSMAYDHDQLHHYNWVMARVTRKSNGALACVNFPNMSEIHRWGGGGWGPSTSSRYFDARRAVERAGIKIVQDPETEYIHMDPEDARRLAVERRTTVSTHYRAIRDGRVKADSKKGKLLLDAAASMYPQRPLDFLLYDPKYNTFGPVRGAYRELIRKAIHKHVYARR